MCPCRNTAEVVLYSNCYWLQFLSVPTLIVCIFHLLCTEAIQESLLSTFHRQPFSTTNFYFSFIQTSHHNFDSKRWLFYLKETTPKLTSKLSPNLLISSNSVRCYFPLHFIFHSRQSILSRDWQYICKFATTT